MIYIVTAESMHWCGYKEERQVEASSEAEAEMKVEASSFEDYMRDYIGHPEEYEAADWEDDDYAAVTYSYAEYDEKEHGQLDWYQKL